jgi:hypothetical protein
MKIFVTSPHYDDIGRVFNLLNVNYSPYQNRLDCDILFLNCGTSDVVPEKELRLFVQNGGILYASDLTSTFVSTVFPNIFNFEGNIGLSGEIDAFVCDAELKTIIGEKVKINFDMSSWSVLNSVKQGKVILQSIQGKPIMVQVPYGKGAIFYTCFHNHAQATEKETIILRLLILKQVSEYKKTSLEKVSEELNVNLSDYKKEFFGDFLTSENTQKEKAKENNIVKNSQEDVWGRFQNPKNNQNNQANEDIWDKL